MAYVTTNPPVCMVNHPNNSIWHYSSTDNVATVTAADYFSNGDALGMKVGDLVIIYDSDAPDGGIAFVTSVTAGGAASALESQAVTT